MLPLSGVRVIDLTRVLAGPIAAQMLGDLGADVIKIERPGMGDDARMLGPPYLEDPAGKANNNNSFFLCANRNKRSAAIDIAKPEGQAIVRGLALKADVLLENFKVGDLKRYGLDYESIRQINPALVYASVTGYGQTGPFSHKPGYDAIFQAAGGLMSVTGIADGQPGAGPMKVGPSIVDYMTGLNGAIGVLAALYNRKANGGVGQHVDVCLMDTVIASLSHYAQIYLVNGVAPPRRGTEGNGGVPGRVFTCADGDIMFVINNDSQFVKAASALGHPELAADPRFVTNNYRAANRVALMKILEDIFIRKPCQHWVDALDAVGVPVGPINNFEQVFAEPQVKHRGMEVTVNHPLRDDLKLIRNAVTFSETPITEYRAPPLLGADTEAVLRDDLGYSPSKIAELREAGIIQLAE